MNIAGVIVEYNPFHNGHLYHLQETKNKTQADLVVAVMSGPFLQRGEPALLSKWERAKLALQAGVDIVIELPYSYATQKAEVFAWGAVSLLHEIGVTHLCFGSEAGDIQPFITTIEALNIHQDRYKHYLKDFLNNGNSYPKAAALAFKKLGLDERFIVDLSQPNNILGFHYIESAQKLQSSMQVQTIQRIKAGYNDAEINDQQIASATAIRKSLFNSSSNDSLAISQLTPEYTSKVLMSSKEHAVLRQWEDFFPYLKYRLMTDSNEQLSQIYEAEEGLENRLIKTSIKSKSFSEFMSTIKTKRYTWTRLQRLCTHILTGITKEDMMPAQNKERPQYIRLLGMSEAGQDFLNNRKKHLEIPLISNVAGLSIPSLDMDIKAQEVYQLLAPEEPHEYQRSPIRYNKEASKFI